MVTLEGWAELMYTQLYGCAAQAEGAAWCKASEAHPLVAPLYFVTFILFGTMIVLNLFIGVIMNSMQEAAVETERAKETQRRLSHGEAPTSLAEELAELHRNAQTLAERALVLQKHAERERAADA